MESLLIALALATLAGITIPLGALAASIERIQPQWLEEELRHSVIAFGGGVLLAAVSLVLVPEGARLLPTSQVILWFSLGGLAFFSVDWLISRKGGSAAQFTAMLLDFIPEALAMGAALASRQPVGLVLAILIALQNLPEGFNAFREISANRPGKTRGILLTFALIALVGPLCAFVGHQFLASSPHVLAAVMLSSAGGIIYLTFEDIAPQALISNHRAPALGAVAGFLVGLVGHIAII